MPTTTTTRPLADGTPPAPSVEPPGTSGTPRRERSHEDQRAERLRANLRRLVEDHHLTLAALARRIGRSNGNLFYNFLAGRSHDLSHATLTRICDAFPGTTLDDLTGRRMPARPASDDIGRVALLVTPASPPPETAGRDGGRRQQRLLAETEAHLETLLQALQGLRRAAEEAGAALRRSLKAR